MSKKYNQYSGSAPQYSAIGSPMKLNLMPGLIVTIATASGFFFVNPAQALNLRTERPDLFDIFNSWAQEIQIGDNETNLMALDPTTLRWAGGVDSVDVFFINEGAGYRNQLFYSANGGPSQIIFDDIASPESIGSEADGPLSLGDGVNLGTFNGKTALDFTIKAHGAVDPNGHIFGADIESNPDGLQHLIAYEYFDTIDEENWVVLGFEDLSGI